MCLAKLAIFDLADCILVVGVVVVVVPPTIVVVVGVLLANVKFDFYDF